MITAYTSESQVRCFLFPSKYLALGLEKGQSTQGHCSTVRFCTLLKKNQTNNNNSRLFLFLLPLTHKYSFIHYTFCVNACTHTHSHRIFLLNKRCVKMSCIIFMNLVWLTSSYYERSPISRSLGQGVSG